MSCVPKEELGCTRFSVWGVTGCLAVWVGDEALRHQGVLAHRRSLSSWGAVARIQTPSVELLQLPWASCGGTNSCRSVPSLNPHQLAPRHSPPPVGYDQPPVVISRRYQSSGTHQSVRISLFPLPVRLHQPSTGQEASVWVMSSSPFHSGSVVGKQLEDLCGPDPTAGWVSLPRLPVV